MSRSFVRNLLYFLVYICITIMGVVVTVWSFTGRYATVPISMLTAVAGALAGSVAAIVIYGMRRWAWFGRSALSAGLALFIWLKFDMAAGGASYIINYFIENINEYYSSELYYIFLTDAMLRKADQPMAVMLMCMLAGYGYMSVMLRGRGGGIAAFAAALSYMLPATMNNELSIYILAGVVILIVCCVVSGTNGSPNSSPEHNVRKAALQSMIWLTAVVLTVFFLLNLVVPGEKYIPSTGLDTIRGKYVFSIEDLRQYSQNVVNPQIEALRGNGISGGSIGKISSIKYKDEPYFLVKAPKEAGTIYLKAFQAATYSNTQWHELDDGIYEKYSGMFEEINKAGFYPCNQVNDTLECLMEVERWGLNVNGPLVLDVSRFNIEVFQYYGDAYSYVPMDALQIDGKDVSSYAEEDRTIRLPSDTKGQMDIQHTYIVTQWRSKTDLVKLIEAGALIEGAAQRRYAGFVYENYLDVNTSCGDRIAEELLPQIMSLDYDINTPEGKAAFINDTVRFFDEGYTYTLRPGITPSGRDFVEYFLFGTKRGFCTYFASSAVMIFRCAGIPARYVEGYIVPEKLYSETESGDYYEAVVTDRYAHAWVEVYIDGVGWIIVDPTPGYSIYAEEYVTEDGNGKESSTQEEGTEADTDETYEEDSEEQDGSMQELPDKTHKEESSITDENGTNTGDNKNSGSAVGDYQDNNEHRNQGAVFFKELLSNIAEVLLMAWKVLLKIMKITAVPLAVILFLIFRQKYMEEKRIKLYNGDCGLEGRVRVCRAMAYYEHILKFLHEYPSASASYGELLQGKRLQGIDAGSISGLIEKALYSGEELNDDELMQIMSYVYAYSRHVYSSLNPVRKLIFKYIYAY